MLNLNLSCSVMERADRILVTSFAIQSDLDGRASPSVRVCRHEPEFRFSPDLSKRAMLQIGDAGSFTAPRRRWRTMVRSDGSVSMFNDAPLMGEDGDACMAGRSWPLAFALRAGHAQMSDR